MKVKKSLNKGVPQEIFIGLVKPVGVDSGKIIEKITKRLTNFFNFDVEVIKVSRDIIDPYMDNFSSRDIEQKDSEFEDQTKMSIINERMNYGNRLRLENGSNYIGSVVAGIIHERRVCNSSGEVNKRVAYIISSFKHPDEVVRLRDTYGGSFILVGILQNREHRENSLLNDGLQIEAARKLVVRDEHEESYYGQKFRETFYLADYFINYVNENSLLNQVHRFIDLLFGNPFITPTFNEYAMFSAFVSALRSADLSRQVGAVITKDREVIAQGANDCPAFGGGLCWPIVEKNYKISEMKDCRDFVRGSDANKDNINEIYQDVLEKLGLEKDDENLKLLQATRLKSLTEFGRSVHAEMAAITMCARYGISAKILPYIALLFLVIIVQNILLLVV